jgi:hypothetical protein
MVGKERIKGARVNGWCGAVGGADGMGAFVLADALAEAFAAACGYGHGGGNTG